MKSKLIVLLASSTVLLSGCELLGCKSCTPEPASSNQMLVEQQSLKSSLENISPSEFDAYVDAQSVSFTTVFEAISVISSQRDYIGKLIADASQEIQDIVESVSVLSQSTINNLNSMIEDNLDRTYNELSEQERTIFNHAITLSTRMSESIALLEKQAFADAKILLLETGIVAYDAEYNLPCIEKKPRLTYIRGSEITVYPNEKSEREYSVELRGNFLANLDKVDITIQSSSGTSITKRAMASSANGATLLLSHAELTDLLGEAEQRTVSVKTTYKYCKETKEPLSLSSTIKLSKGHTYHVELDLQPMAYLYSYSKRFFYYSKGTNGKCDRDFYDDQTYTIGGDYRIYDIPSIKASSGGCGSHSVGIIAFSPQTFTYRARIKGCGYNWLINCEGNGHLNATLDAPIRKARLHKLNSTFFAKAEYVPGDSLVIAYNRSFPSNMKGSPFCRYTGRIVNSVNGQILEFNQDTPPNSILEHGVARDTCDVTLRIL